MEDVYVHVGGLKKEGAQFSASEFRRGLLIVGEGGRV